MRFQTRFGLGLRSSSASRPPDSVAIKPGIERRLGDADLVERAPTGRAEVSTVRMISSFSDAEYSFDVLPIRDHAFFEQAVLER